MSVDDATTTVLGPLGLSQVEEKIYRDLLRWGGGSRSEVIQSAAVSERVASKALSALEQKGMLARSLGRPLMYVAAPPQAAVEILILRRQEELLHHQEELEQVRLATRQLVAEAGSERPRQDSAEMVEVIAGGEGVSIRNYQLMMGAERELLGFSVGPLEVPDESFVNFKLDILRRGVKGKVIYSPDALNSPGVLNFIEAVRLAGEEPRIAERLPMFLLIVDRRVAFLPARPDQPGRDNDCLVVHPSSLLDLLLAQFDSTWERSARFDSGATTVDTSAEPDDTELSADERRILALLGSGMHDVSIATQLGMGQRTVQRQVRHMMEVLGTRTRFQTGLEAGRLGLLGPAREETEDRRTA